MVMSVCGGKLHHGVPIEIDQPRRKNVPGWVNNRLHPDEGVLLCGLMHDVEDRSLAGRNQSDPRWGFDARSRRVDNGKVVSPGGVLTRDGVLPPRFVEALCSAFVCVADL
eukprot:7381101-Prymnesium_polylepis.1